MSNINRQWKGETEFVSGPKKDRFALFRPNDTYDHNDVVGYVYSASVRDEILAAINDRDPIFRVPALDHDAMMLQRYGSKVGARGRLERRIVFHLIKHLEKFGFVPEQVFDGEEFTPCNDAKSAMELLFNLDEASLRFGRLDNAETEHGVLLVFGNGIDCISDWAYSDGDSDGFDAAMRAFDAEVYA